MYKQTLEYPKTYIPMAIMVGQGFEKAQFMPDGIFGYVPVLSYVTKESMSYRGNGSNKKEYEVVPCYSSSVVYGEGMKENIPKCDQDGICMNGQLARIVSPDFEQIKKICDEMNSEQCMAFAMSGSYDQLAEAMRAYGQGLDWCYKQLAMVEQKGQGLQKR